MPATSKISITSYGLSRLGRNSTLATTCQAGKRGRVRVTLASLTLTAIAAERSCHPIVRPDRALATRIGVLPRTPPMTMTSAQAVDAYNEQLWNLSAFVACRD